MHLNVAAVIAVSGLALGSSAYAACDIDQVQIRGDWGQAQFHVEIADDAAERGQGLMHREDLASSAGMLFMYANPQHVGFWMKNTLIPLDMIFIDEAGVVQRIHENAIPHDESVIDGGENILGVLEINGGMARIFGISVGSQLQHPNFDQEIAVWPCEGS